VKAAMPDTPDGSPVETAEEYDKIGRDVANFAVNLFGLENLRI
jgi:HD superfamily phosphodiesterase